MIPPLQGRLLTQYLAALLLVCTVIAGPYNRYEDSRALPQCEEIPTCSVEERGAVKPFPPECTHFIYCDGEGNEVVSVCTNGFEFSPHLLYCTTPEEAMCPKCTMEPPTTTEEISTIAECPDNPTCSVNDLGYLLPYPSDCSKFIYCDAEGDGVISVCIPGLEFSPSLGYCTTPEEALCPYCEVRTTPEEITTTQAQMTTEEETTTPTPPETTIGVCPPNPICESNERGVEKPYPEDCTKYIYCSDNGKAEISVCTPGNHFSPELLYCTDPEEAQCPLCYPSTTPTEVQTTEAQTTEAQTTEAQTTEAQTTEAQTTESETTQEDTTFQEDYTSTPEIFTTSQVPCPEVPSCDLSTVGETFPHVSDCNKYYYCNEFGEGEESFCPQDLHYNHELGTCDTPDIANCLSCPTTTDLPTTETSTTTLPVCDAIPTCSIFDLGLRKPYPPDCNLYIYCDLLSVAKIRYCPSELVFSPSALRCMMEEQANCPLCVEVTTVEEETSTTEYSSTSEDDCPPTPTCTKGEVGVSKPYPRDCSMYVYCGVDGTADISHCPPGQIFSPSLSHCVPEDESDCKVCAITESPSTEESTTDVSLTTELCSIEPQPCTDSGITIPYPPDCTLYVYCDISLEPQISKCPEGEHFSPSELRCMSPDQANCPSCGDSTSTFEIETTTELSTTTLPTCAAMIPCREGGSEGVLRAYPENCRKYAYCLTDGSYILRSCAFNFEFSRLLRRCVPPSLSGCALCQPIITTTEPTTIGNEESTTPEEVSSTTEVFLSTTEDFLSTTPDTCDPPRTCQLGDGGLWLPYPSDCMLYMFCKDDTTFELRRCPSGQHFSPIKNHCMLPEEAGCTFCVSTTLPPCVPTQECKVIEYGLLKPYPPDCSKYIYCNAVTAEIRSCPAGREFNPTKNKCEAKDIAGCTQCISSSLFYNYDDYPEY